MFCGKTTAVTIINIAYYCVAFAINLSDSGHLVNYFTWLLTAQVSGQGENYVSRAVVALMAVRAVAAVACLDESCCSSRDLRCAASRAD